MAQTKCTYRAGPSAQLAPLASQGGLLIMQRPLPASSLCLTCPRWLPRSLNALLALAGNCGGHYSTALTRRKKRKSPFSAVFPSRKKRQMSFSGPPTAFSAAQTPAVALFPASDITQKTPNFVVACLLTTTFDR